MNWEIMKFNHASIEMHNCNLSCLLLNKMSPCFIATWFVISINVQGQFLETIPEYEYLTASIPTMRRSSDLQADLHHDLHSLKTQSTNSELELEWSVLCREGFQCWDYSGELIFFVLLGLVRKCKDARLGFDWTLLDVTILVIICIIVWQQRD